MGAPRQRKSFNAGAVLPNRDRTGFGRSIQSEQSHGGQRDEESALSLAAHAHDVVTRIYVEDFAGDSGGQIGAEERRRIADLFDADVLL